MLTNATKKESLDILKGFCAMSNIELRERNLCRTRVRERIASARRCIKGQMPASITYHGIKLAQEAWNNYRAAQTEYYSGRLLVIDTLAHITKKFPEIREPLEHAFFPEQVEAGK